MSRSALARTIGIAALSVVALLAAIPSASAQEPCSCPERDSLERDRVRLDARAGIAIPTADMRDYVDEGPVIGAGLGYRLDGFDERVSVRADWTAALMRPAHRGPLRSKGVDIPPRGSETDLHHLTAGLQVEISDPEVADVEVRVHGGAGVTFLSTEETELAEGGDFTQFTVDGGIELAVPLGEGISFIGRGDVYVLPFRAGAPSHLLKEVTLPVSGGLAIGL